MGLLFLGTPLVWDEAKQYADHVRTHGITQFLHIWDRLKDREGDELLWGDEVRLHSVLALLYIYGFNRSNTWLFLLTIMKRTLSYP